MICNGLVSHSSLNHTHRPLGVILTEPWHRRSYENSNFQNDKLFTFVNSTIVLITWKIDVKDYKRNVMSSRVTFWRYGGPLAPQNRKWRNRLLKNSDFYDLQNISFCKMSYILDYPFYLKKKKLFRYKLALKLYSLIFNSSKTNTVTPF